MNNIGSWTRGIVVSGTEEATKNEVNGTGEGHSDIPSIDTEAKADDPEHVVPSSEAVSSE